MPQTTNPLFIEDDLTDWLRRPVTPEAASIVEKVVWGWLRPLVKLTDRPADPSDELLAWALELGGIAFANPEGLSSYQLESETSQYSSERRDEILQLAASGGTSAPGAVAAPSGNFPRTRRYPDPAERGYHDRHCW